MKCKRILSCLLAAALTLCLLPGLAVPARAVGAFSDVSDLNTAVNVEVLRTMGVINGTSATTFSPGGSLTRAQFCKMAVMMMGKGGAVGQYKSYTIFPDVRASHWAAGYINLAVRGETKLISGYPNGKFLPDQTITYAQTVTILMRMLGYADSDVGAVWPAGYLNTAASIGLTDGLNISANSALTRAQAAQLFCNLLRTKNKEGTLYASAISASTVTDTVLLNSDASAADGSSGALLLSGGATYKVADNRTAGAVLAGRKGTLLLNSAGQAITFLPDAGGTSKTVVLTEAKAASLTDTAGSKYAITSATVAYYQNEKTTYGEMYFNLRSGSPVTLYFNGGGKIEYLFAGAASAADDAVIVSRAGSTAGFERLTSSSSYTIYRNGLPVSAAALQPYDVAVYDGASGSIRVCDRRITARYEDVSPNLASPTSVTFLGKTFSVLPTATDALSAFRIGNQVTLLLTEDNRVAGAVPTTTLKSDNVGIVTAMGGTATVQLLNGITVSGKSNVSGSGASSYLGQLVKVSSGAAGQISLSKLSSSGVTGALNVARRTLGTVALADNVQLYEKVGSGALRQIKLADIPTATVATAYISYAEKDAGGAIRLIVFNNVTGDGFVYGRYHYSAPYREDGVSYPAESTFENGAVSLSCGQYQLGNYMGVSLSGDGSTITGSVGLTKLAGVANNAWNSNESVSAKGVTYLVSDEVQCYNETTGKWISLSAARSFAETADLYYDGIGQKIRVVVVKQ